MKIYNWFQMKPDKWLLVLAMILGWDLEISRSFPGMGYRHVHSCFMPSPRHKYDAHYRCRHIVIEGFDLMFHALGPDRIQL